MIASTSIGVATDKEGNTCAQKMGLPVDPLPVLIRGEAALWHLNAFNPKIQVVRIEYNLDDPNTRYNAYHGAGKAIYSGSDLAALAQALSVHSPEVDALFVMPDKFRENKQEAFRTSLMLQWTQLRPKTTIRMVKWTDSQHPESNSAFVSALKDVFQKPITVDEVSKPIEVTSGERKGWYHFVLRLTTATGKMIVSVFVRTREAANDLVARFSSATGGGSVSASSVAQIVADMRRALKKRKPDASDADLVVELHDQFDRNYLVSYKQPDAHKVG